MIAASVRTAFVIILVLALSLQFPSVDAKSNPKTPDPVVKWNRVGMASYGRAFMVEDNKSFLVVGWDRSLGTNYYGAWLLNSKDGSLEWKIQSGWGDDFIPDDLDGNGQVDVLVVAYGHDWAPTQIKIYCNRGTTPTTSNSWPGYADLIDIKDLDGDGYRDLVFRYNETGDASSPFSNYSIEARNGKDLSLMWSFDLNERFPGNHTDAYVAKWTDLNHDGAWDPVFVYYVYDISPFKMTHSGVDILNGKDGSTLKEMWPSDPISDLRFKDDKDNNDLSSVSLWTNWTWFNDTIDRLVTYDKAGNLVSNLSLGNVTVSTWYWMKGTSGTCDLTLVKVRETGPGGQYAIEALSTPDLAMKWNATVISKGSYPNAYEGPDWNNDGTVEIIVQGDKTWVFNGNGSGLIQSFPVPEDADFVLDLAGDIAVFNFNCGRAYEPNFLWAFSIRTGELIMNYTYYEMAHSSFLSDIDNDGNPELLMATENRNTSLPQKYGRVVVYDMDPIGSAVIDPGGQHPGPGQGTGPSQKITTRVIGLAEDPYSLLLLVILITGFCIIIVYNSLKEKGPRPEDTRSRPTSAFPSRRTSDRSAQGVLRRFPPVS
jgi:hypothetical protein